MIPTLTPSTATATPAPERRASPAVIRQAALGLGSVVLFVGAALLIALLVGATAVFNVLVCGLFTLLWIALAAALVVSPQTLHDTWHALRALPLLVQAVVWLLFLPITLGLWIWERTWSLPIRLVLVAGIALCNVFMFVPR
jgi:hypothetical protein